MTYPGYQRFLVFTRSGATIVFFAPGPSSLRDSQNTTAPLESRVPMAELVLAWLNNWIRKKVDFKTTTPSNQGTSSCCKSFYHSWTLTRAACTSQGLSVTSWFLTNFNQSSFLLQITTSASVCRNHNKIVTNLVPTQNKLNSVHNTKSL